MDSPKIGNGKASASPDREMRGFRPQNTQNGVIKVEPPRREDMQPSYAQILQGETEAETHGWYGSMSKSRVYSRHLSY